ncbi:hypothetical protein I3842_06G008100 [Carya illinoinensis]|uniref:Uncharacterized protein n=1 Tax=Carya illinoinensis TaxID=32201 RepID=A0A922ERW3_CARIL|nr:hypothetical protein I3842_06G008100 [Carya illinoinensis]
MPRIHYYSLGTPHGHFCQICLPNSSDEILSLKKCQDQGASKTIYTQGLISLRPYSPMQYRPWLRVMPVNSNGNESRSQYGGDIQTQWYDRWQRSSGEWNQSGDGKGNEAL